MNAESAVIVKNVSKAFKLDNGNRFQAIKGVNFHCNLRESVCLLGPTGCGKSTILKLISGLRKPTTGEIVVENRKVDGIHAGVCLLFQENTLFPWKTALQNVLFPLVKKRAGKKEKREIAKYYLNYVGLGEFLNAYPYELSGGMRQRVSIAQVLALNVNIIMMDEPFSSLDDYTREILEEDVQIIWVNENKTALFVTHNIETAVFMADRILMMDIRPGRIVKEIPVRLQKPRERADSEFIRLCARVRKIFHELVIDNSDTKQASSEAPLCKNIRKRPNISCCCLSEPLKPGRKLNS
jgi:NitT/TauT family transport system ATP-binding protein